VFNLQTLVAYVIQLREKQMRNFMVSLMSSQGVPMITMGDEYGHSKNGNNNTYCHDFDINWFRWNLVRGESVNAQNAQTQSSSFVFL
jgi:pullulanase/glycogen debranching enzyme